MVDDGIMKQYADIDLDDETFELKYICRVIDGNYINSMKGICSASSVDIQ